MSDNILYFKRTASGHFQQVKENRQHNSVANESLEDLNILEQLRSEWKQKRLNTEAIDKIESLITLLKQPENRARLDQFFQKVKMFLKSDKTKGVMKKMTDLNLSDLMKKMAENGDTSKLMDKVLSDPVLSKEAMSMMKDMLNDEEKLKSMTDMMSSLLDKDE